MGAKEASLEGETGPIGVTLIAPIRHAWSAIRVLGLQICVYP